MKSRVNDAVLEKAMQQVSLSPLKALFQLGPARFFQLYTYFIVTQSPESYRMMNGLWVTGTHVRSERKC